MKNAFNKNLYRNLPVFVIVFLSIFSAVTAQTKTGVLQGEIKTAAADGSVANLPGAKIVLTGAKAASEPLTVIADENGYYQFKELKAGNYILEISLEGFAAVKKAVSIGENETVTENFSLGLEQVEASVTVTADANQLEATNSTTSQKITTKTLQNVPLPEEKFQEALPLVPGVVRGSDGQINIKGGSASQTGTLIGNSNGDDPVTGNMAIDLPLEAVESVEVVSTPFSAEFGNFSGGVVQVQTRSGSNKFNFGLTNFFPRLRERGGSIRGIESIKPRLNFSGPIIKDKFFFFQSFEYKFLQTRVESLPDLKSDTKLESFDSFTRLDYNFSDRHTLSTTVALFPQKLDYVNLNTFNPQETAANLHQRGWMTALNDQYVTTKGGLLQTTFSVKKADADVFGNSAADFMISPQTNSGGYFNRQHRESMRYEAQSIYSLPGFKWQGDHSVKFGGGFSYTTFNGTSVNKDVWITDADGKTLQNQSYVGNGVLTRNKSEIGFFVQDKWALNQKLTLDLGVRFDRDSLGKTLNPAPRFGFVYSPWSDNKTIIRGGVGMFYSKIPLNVGVFEQNQNVLIRRFAADGITPAGETLYRNVLENGDIKTPYSIGWNIRVDREINSRLLIRAGYEQHETKRDFLLNPVLGENPGEGVYALSNGASSSYRELLLMARVKIQENRDWYFSYTHSRAVGDLNTFGNYAGNLRNPVLRENEYGRLGFDAPNRFLSWGDVGLPLGITLTPVIDWRTGLPYSTVDENQNFIGARNADRRFPDFFSADVQVSKDFNLRFRGKEYKLRAGVKFFNVTNHFNPRDVQNNIDSPDFGAYYNGVGRRTRFKFEVIF